MQNSFKRELKKNRIAEVILKQVLESIYDDKALVDDVTDSPECYHKGDIRITDKNGNVYYLDAKNDGVIHKTQRVFCETYKYFFKDMKRHTGFMEDGLYDFLTIVDRKSEIIYILDFAVLKKIHKDYKEVESMQDDAFCYGAIIPLTECKKEKALLYTIKYEGENDSYWATDLTIHQNKDVLNFER